MLTFRNGGMNVSGPAPQSAACDVTRRHSTSEERNTEPMAFSGSALSNTHLPQSVPPLCPELWVRDALFATIKK